MGRVAVALSGATRAVSRARSSLGRARPGCHRRERRDVHQAGRGGRMLVHHQRGRGVALGAEAGGRGVSGVAPSLLQHASNSAPNAQTRPLGLGSLRNSLPWSKRPRPLSGGGQLPSCRCRAWAQRSLRTVSSKASAPASRLVEGPGSEPRRARRRRFCDVGSVSRSSAGRVGRRSAYRPYWSHVLSTQCVCVCVSLMAVCTKRYEGSL